MPTYVFNKESFLKFIEGHLDENTIIIVSSDVTEFKKKKIESYVGEKDYYLTEFAITADILNLSDEEFDELMKYAIVFAEAEELSETGKKALR